MTRRRNTTEVRGRHGPARLGPVAGDSASMPTQQGVGCDEPAGSLPSRQGRRDRTEKCPVLIGEGWSAVLAVQDCELVAQHDDLKVLRASRTYRQACQRHEQQLQNATHRTPGCNRIMPRQRTRPHLGTHRRWSRWTPRVWRRPCWTANGPSCGSASADQLAEVRVDGVGEARHGGRDPCP